jgi:hypothetical protein
MTFELNPDLVRGSPAPGPEFRKRFLDSPQEVINAAGLEEHEKRAALDIDMPGLRMAARSYELKRAGRRSRRSLLRLPWLGV